MKWAYDRAEVIADGIVHALGVALVVAGVLTLLIQVAPRDRNHPRPPSR